MWEKIKKLNEERGAILAAMEKILNGADAEKRSLTSEEDGKFNELNTRSEAIKSQVDRYTQAHNLGKLIEGDNAANIPRGPIASAHPGGTSAVDTRATDDDGSETRVLRDG